MTVNRSLRLLFLSNMMREKGFKDVVEAVALLRESGMSVEATFAGAWVSEADRSEFQQLVEAYVERTYGD